MEYDSRWDRKLPSKDPKKPSITLKESLILSANKSFDVDRLIGSAYGQKLIDMLEPCFLSDDPTDPAVVRYPLLVRGGKPGLCGGPGHPGREAHRNTRPALQGMGMGRKRALL